MRTDVLLLAAHLPEFEGLQDALGPTHRGTRNGVHVSTAAVGVGLSAAGAGTARALSEFAPRAVVLLGSVGNYRGRAEVAAPLSLCVVTQAHLVDAASVLGRAALPGPMAGSVHSDPALVAGLQQATGAVTAEAANTLGITTDDELASALAAAGPWDVENLEVHAVLDACRVGHVPAAALLVTTNAVGADGRAQWLANQSGAARRGVEAVVQWVDAGAPGVGR